MRNEFKLYYEALTNMEYEVDHTERHGFSDDPYEALPRYMALTKSWRDLEKAGHSWANYVIDKISIPPKKAKAIEMATRLFYKPYNWGRKRHLVIPKIMARFNKNKKRFDLLLKAGQWKERVEGSGVFAHGPFMVHNTIHASDKILDSAMKMVDSVVRLAPRTGLPGFKQMLYGDLVLVGQLGRKSWAAWYMPGKDSIYLRPVLRGASKEQMSHHLLHEIGHRYWAKKLPNGIKKEWTQYHNTQAYADAGDMPQVGDTLPFRVNKKNVRVESKSGGVATLVDVQTNELVGKMTLQKMYIWMSRHVNYPTLYSATSAEEHFCETLALRALGQLKNPKPFDDIVLGAEARKVASSWLLSQH